MWKIVPITSRKKSQTWVEMPYQHEAREFQGMVSKPGRKWWLLRRPGKEKYDRRMVRL